MAVPFPEPIAEDAGQSPVQDAAEAVLRTVNKAEQYAIKVGMSHLLLPDGAFVADLDCGLGIATAAVAALCPRMNILGIDALPSNVSRAAQKYALPNLEFRAASEVGEGQFDAAILRFAFGRVYSKAEYDERMVVQQVLRAASLLKPGGQLLIMDHLAPDEDVSVLLEFPAPTAQAGAYQRRAAEEDDETLRQNEQDITDLLWFAHNAHGKSGTGLRGFHLEERPPRRPLTRLFRLPLRWAQEYLLRKRDFRDFRYQIQQDFTCLSRRDLERLLTRACGMRLSYRAQWTDIAGTRDAYEQRFRLYADVPAGAADRLGWPPSAQIFVARQITDRSTQLLHEHKNLAEEASSLQVLSLRDEQRGNVYDVIVPSDQGYDLLVWRRNASGRIEVLLGTDVEQPLTNLLEREAQNLDGRLWSGHLFALPRLPIEELDAKALTSTSHAAKVLRLTTGLTPVIGQGFELSLSGFAAPDLIDRETKTLRVEAGADMSLLKPGYAFYDAEDVLHACSVGLIPNAWIEVEVSALLEQQTVELPAWLDPELPIGRTPPPPERILRADAIFAQTDADAPLQGGDPVLPTDLSKNYIPALGGRFRQMRAPSGRVRAMRSSFANEVIDDGRMVALSGGAHDFAALPPEVANIAAILPLTQDFDGLTLMGFQMDHMPVPMRNGQDGPTMTLPTLPLPAHIVDKDAARAYVAEYFDTKMSMVVPLGESFYSDISVCPQRVYPFAVAAEPWNGQYDIKYAPIYFLEDITKISNSTSLLWRYGYMMARRCLKAKKDKMFEPRMEAKAIRQGKSNKKNWSVPKSANG